MRNLECRLRHVKVWWLTSTLTRASSAGWLWPSATRWQWLVTHTPGGWWHSDYSACHHDSENRVAPVYKEWPSVVFYGYLGFLDIIGVCVWSSLSLVSGIYNYINIHCHYVISEMYARDGVYDEQVARRRRTPGVGTTNMAYISREQHVNNVYIS